LSALHPTRGRPRSAGAQLLLFAILAIDLAAVAWYFGWLLAPDRVGTLVLYVMLIAAECFNLTQAIGFWWTVSRDRSQPSPREVEHRMAQVVDVLIPVYDEPVPIVEPTVAFATRIRGAVRVALLDDAGRPEMAELARRWNVTYIAREDRSGAKAGNLNNALRRTTAPFVAVFDCDHVPSGAFLEQTLGHLEDERVAYVQTPQSYANRARTPIAAGAAAQQDLFFGTIARGKSGAGAMFCCGTNMILRRSALEEVGGFPEESLTEDILLSIRLHERGWKSVYVPEVLARGLGPEDLPSYVGQQVRWARGCVAAIPRLLTARLPLRIRLQYLLSCMYFLSGWTLLVYMSFPIIRIFTGAQPVATATADQFLLHFAPYFLLAIVSVALAGGGRYTFRALALASATFWVHLWAVIANVFRVPRRFVVTAKGRPITRRPLVAIPTLMAAGALLVAAAYALVTDRSPAALNNVAFALMHATVLLAGVLPALSLARPRGGRGMQPEATRRRGEAEPSRVTEGVP
jgi:cellulose synthase (UDP-forming)